MSISRFKSRRALRSRKNSEKTSLFGTLTLVSILTGILLFLSNEIQNDQVQATYCGDFGFYGKSLVLMKNGTFKFTYHGCSQSYGNISGAWNVTQEYLELVLEKKSEFINSRYKMEDTYLISLSEDDGFVLCEYYEYPI